LFERKRPARCFAPTDPGKTLEFEVDAQKG
jgi:hypothetical protein